MKRIIKSLPPLALQIQKIGILIKVAAITFIILTACATNPRQLKLATCTTTNTNFQELYVGTLASNSIFKDVVAVDLITHEYTFKVNTVKTICNVGYQGNSALFAALVPYKIELYNATTNTIVYTGNHVFNAAFTDYVSITPTTLNPYNTYVIRRIASNYLGDIANTKGKVCMSNTPLLFPATSGELTILCSNFYDSGGKLVGSYLNCGIPYIDIVFQ